MGSRTILAPVPRSLPNRASLAFTTSLPEPSGKQRFTTRRPPLRSTTVSAFFDLVVMIATERARTGDRVRAPVTTTLDMVGWCWRAARNQVRRIYRGQ
jgi:hypothetical protein